MMWENLRYDFLSGWGGDPWWYYAMALGFTTQPWTILILVALLATVGRLRTNTSVRLMWCLAILPVLLMSIPDRKHHHYLVPVLGAWAILGACGASVVWRWGMRQTTSKKAILLSYFAGGTVLAGAMLFVCHRELPGVSMLTAAAASVAVGLGVVWVGFGVSRKVAWEATLAFAVTFAIASGFVQLCYFNADPKRLADRAFAQRVEREVPADATLLIAHREALDFFLLQFYVRPQARLLHNITFVKDDAIGSPVVYVVSRGFDADYLRTVGRVEEVFQADFSRREKNPRWRWTLFRLTYRVGVDRHPRPAVDALQALRRPEPNDESPYLGDRPPAYDPPLTDGAKSN